MQLIRGLHNLNLVKGALSNGCVLSIGNFDGLHLGHQQVLHAVAKEAKTKDLPSVVMMFEPLPIEFFAPNKAPVRLMNLREKLQAFQATNIDYVLLVRFNAKFAGLSAQQFVHQVLLEGLKVRHLVVGDDFRFGKQRKGDFAYLHQQGQQYGFSVTDMPTYSVTCDVTCGETMMHRVSSTRVRAALAKPDLQEASALLGKAFRFDGRVIHGQKIGRTLGFPTLNLNPKRLQMPVMGVYAVSVDGIADTPWPGIANLGLRPTVDGLRPSIEVHLFNWTQDLYGQHVGVTLEKHIRPEMKFDGLDTLKNQIQRDAHTAKQFFKL